MLISLLILLAFVTVPLAGGRLRRLAELPIRAGWLLLVALALQVLVISVVPHWPVTVLAAGHLLSYVVAGAFVWLNRRIPGLWIVALGGGLNLAAIAANGGVMPTSPSALETAGLSADAGSFENSAVIEGARLWFLGDVFAIPSSWPLANVFSVGDVLIVVGVFVGLHMIGGSRLVPPRFHWQPDGSPAATDPARPTVG